MLDTESIPNVANHVVDTTSDLESAFDNLSAGEIIWVGTPDTPYRPSQWLDVNVSGVKVVFQSQFAADGSAIVKPADGSNVGGIRIGTSSSVRDIEIRGLGFNGNQSTMDDTVKRLHALIVDDAQQVSIGRCYATNTHPYHEHDSGGSGVSVRTAATSVTISDCFIEDIGDRGIQLAGDRVTVTGCTIVNGYDRSISMDVTQPDGVHYNATNVRITDNYVADNSDGSLIAASGSADSAAGTGEKISNYIIANNVGDNSSGRGGIRFRNVDGGVDENIIISGNTLREGSQVGIGTGAGNGTRGPLHIVVSDNVVINFGDGISIAHHDYAIVGNYVKDSGNVGCAGGQNGAIIANTVRNPTNAGISGGMFTAFEANHITQAGQQGVFIKGRGCAVIGNTIEDANTSGSAYSAIDLAGGNNCTVLGNRTNGGAYGVDEGGAGDNNAIVGNVVLNSSTSPFNISGTKTTVKANTPEHYDLETTLSLSSGGTALTGSIPRADADSSNQGLEIHVTAFGDPGNDAAFDARPFWDDTDKTLKVQVEEVANAGGGDAKLKIRANPRLIDGICKITLKPAIKRTYKNIFVVA